MSDINNLFRDVATAAASPPSTETVEADLARGHVALARVHRQRTIRRSILAGGSLVVATAAVVAATQLGGTSQQAHPRSVGIPSIPPHGGPPQSSHHGTSSIKLVAYNGRQLEGFTVDRVPAGWHLSTSTASALLITKDGSKDDDPNAFEGKLAVLTSSVDEHGLGKGADVSVNGQPGVVSDQGSYGIMLRYNDPNGFGVDIQAPADLHWTDDQIVAFAVGVHVTGDAVHTHG
jgi:hypothetical protein